MLDSVEKLFYLFTILSFSMLIFLLLLLFLYVIFDLFMNTPFFIGFHLWETWLRHGVVKVLPIRIVVPF